MTTPSITTAPPVTVNGLPAVIIFLLREEIKHFAFIKRLENVGFNSDTNAADIGTAVLALMGFDDPSDEFIEWYWYKLEHYTKDSDCIDHTELNEKALDFYVDLEVKKRSATPAIIERPGEV
jgi:hypothetical protein